MFVGEQENEHRPEQYQVHLGYRVNQYFIVEILQKANFDSYIYS